jgi:hypothetical protein
MGKARLEKTGATVKTASKRKKGQISGDSQADSWASVMVIIAADVQVTSVGIDSIVRRK